MANASTDLVQFKSFSFCLVLGRKEHFIGATKVCCGRAYRAYHQHEERREKKQVDNFFLMDAEILFLMDAEIFF